MSDVKAHLCSSQFLKVVSDYMGFQISNYLFCDRSSGTSRMRTCYENSQNLTVKNIIDNQDFKNMSKSDKFTVIGDFYLKQMASGYIVLDNKSGFYPAYSGKTPKHLAELFLKTYNQNNDYYYENGFIKINPNKWGYIKNQAPITDKNAIGKILGL
jgi:hypothetical protein